MNHAVVNPIVSHPLHQDARISQRVAFFHMGKLIEMNDTERFFNTPTISCPRPTSPDALANLHGFER